jgi:hypothetical protein
VEAGNIQPILIRFKWEWKTIVLWYVWYQVTDLLGINYTQLCVCVCVCVCVWVGRGGMFLMRNTILTVPEVGTSLFTLLHKHVKVSDCLWSRQINSNLNSFRVLCWRKQKFLQATVLWNI